MLRLRREGRRLRTRGLPDARDEQLRRTGLRQKEGRAQLGRLGEHLLSIKAGDDHRAGGAILLLQLLQNGESVDLRENHIGDQHVRVQLAHKRERRFPVVRRADERHVALPLKHLGQVLPEVLAGIRQKH